MLICTLVPPSNKNRGKQKKQKVNKKQVKSAIYGKFYNLFGLFYFL